MKYLSASSLISSARASLFLAESCFESFTSRRKRESSFFSSSSTPATHIGPSTGPLPASSIPAIMFLQRSVRGRYLSTVYIFHVLERLFMSLLVYRSCAVQRHYGFVS